jgi:hypothetical protein
MRLTHRVALAITPLAMAAVLIPTQTADAATIHRVKPPASHALERPTQALTMEELEALMDQQDADLLQQVKSDAGRSRSYRIHRMRNFDWWIARYGMTKYLGVRFTWTATWRMKRLLDNHGTGGIAVICGFMSPYCGAVLWFDTWYLKYMVNRALKRRQCFGYVYRIGGWPAPPVILRNYRCDR